jgi:hypothetical protein
MGGLMWNDDRRNESRCYCHDSRLPSRTVTVTPESRPVLNGIVGVMTHDSGSACPGCTLATNIRTGVTRALLLRRALALLCGASTCPTHNNMHGSKRKQ